MELRDQTVEINSIEGYSKQEISELTQQLNKSYEEQLKRITEMVNVLFPLFKEAAEVARCLIFITQINNVCLITWVDYRLS